MGALWKLSFVLLSMSLYVALSSSEEQDLQNPENAVIFSDVPASRHGWVACNYTESPGASCFDCHTRIICTKIGGFLIPCWWPGAHSCVHGECEAAPSDDCAPGSTPEPPSPTNPWDPSTTQNYTN